MNEINKKLSIEKVNIVDGEIFIKISGRDAISYVFFWLRDNCRCDECYNTTTSQRRHDILEIPIDAKPKLLNAEDDIMSIEWSDEHKSKYSAKFLWDCYPTTWKQKSIIKKYLWSGFEVENEVAVVQRDDFLKSEEVLKQFLNSLVTYGVAFIDGVAPNLQDTEVVVKRVAPVQETLFGNIWSCTSNLARADTAYTTMSLGTHTDNTYFTEAAGLLVFHILEHDGEGGDSVLLDGFRAAEELRKENPKAFNILTKCLQPAEYIEQGYHHVYTAPVLTIDPVNELLRQIRYNGYDRTAHCVGTGKESEEYYMALRELAKKLSSSKDQWIFKLKPGRVMFFDNWRVLHGRVAFSGKRVLGGAYVPRGEWLSAARVHGLIQ